MQGRRGKPSLGPAARVSGLSGGPGPTARVLPLRLPGTDPVTERSRRPRPGQVATGMSDRAVLSQAQAQSAQSRARPGDSELQSQ